MYRSESINIIALSDLHGNISGFDDMHASIIDADIILLCGDITHFGDEHDASEIIRSVRQYDKTTYAVSGNCDFPGVSKMLMEEKMDLEGKIYTHHRIALTGLNGSLPCPGRTPNERTETEYKVLLDNLNNMDYTYDTDLILVSHQPPFGTVCDRLTSGNHVGSHAIREFIERKQPLICFTGHIHEGIGVDRINQTIIINPGSFRSGKYAQVALKLTEQDTVISDLKLHSREL